MTLSSDPIPSDVLTPAGAPWPLDPVLCRLTRGGVVESVHRGAWCVARPDGGVVDGAGDVAHPFYTRSSIKALQALPLLETGAAERFALRVDELALAIASHNGEPIHTERVAALLARLGLDEEALRCGPQAPSDGETRFELRRSGGRPGALHNNCSGKHAGFLALALHLGVDPARYLDPDSEGQRLVRAAVAAMSDQDERRLVPGIDGCSAPNYRLPLRALATAFARLTNPEGLAPERRAACERLTAAAARHPELVAGTRDRLDTDLMRVTGGRLFAKIGAEAVYVIGHRGGGHALALKIDDGANRALYHVVFALLARLGWLTADERDALVRWHEPRLFNRAGLEVGRVEVVLA